MKKGVLITLYGINNIGKTTQAKLLVDYLKSSGHKSIYLKYPIYDLEPTGPFLDSVLRSSKQTISEDELQMWFTVNRYQFEPQLRQLLKDGFIVIAEDYIGTGIAWGTAKGLQTGWLEQINQHLLSEDYSILLQGSRDLAVREDEHVHEQNDDLIEKCRLVHEDLADKYGWERVPVISGEIQKTSKFICNVVDDFLLNR